MTRAPGDLVAPFDVDVSGDTLPEPSWDVAPGSEVCLLVDAVPRGDDAGGPPVRRLASARLGLVPSWATDPSGGPAAAFADVETVADDRATAEAVHSRRGLVAVTGWRPSGDASGPLLALPDDEVLLVAAVYEWWRAPAAPDGGPTRWLLSTALLTCPGAGAGAGGGATGASGRLPVFVGADVMDEWLDPDAEVDGDLLAGLVGEAHQVARRLAARR